MNENLLKNLNLIGMEKNLNWIEMDLVRVIKLKKFKLKQCIFSRVESNRLEKVTKILQN